MSFSEIVDSFCKHLESTPEAPKSERRAEKLARSGKLFDLSKVKGINANPQIMQSIERAQTALPATVTPEQHFAHTKALAGFRKRTLESFKTLSAEDKRKLSAIAKAAISGGTVAEQYRFMMPGSSTFSMASAQMVREGLEKVKAEGLDLDAATWGVKIDTKSSSKLPEFFKKLVG